jgi:hypothetical protein
MKKTQLSPLSLVIDRELITVFLIGYAHDWLSEKQKIYKSKKSRIFDKHSAMECLKTDVQTLHVIKKRNFLDTNFVDNYSLQNEIFV